LGLLPREPEGEAGEGPQDEHGLGLAIRWIQQALISAFEENCPLRPVRKGRKSRRWTVELQLLRREVQRLFNRHRAKMTRIAGTSTERPNEDTGRRYERLPKRHGGPSVAL
jgi:hypothetical protein